MARTKTRVCNFLGPGGKSCPQLAEPGTSRCAQHPSRPKNQPWSGQRPPWERQQRAKLRAAAIERAGGHNCERCPARDIPVECHHIRAISPTATVDDVLLVCSPCHQAIDPHARANPGSTR